MLRIHKYPPTLLSSYIESFNIYRFEEETDIQLFPKGVFEIVFQSNDHFQHNTAYSTGWELRPQNFIGGLHNKSYQVKPNGHDSFCLVVEFKPNTAKYFIPEKLHNFQNSLTDINEIWGKSACALSRKISKEPSDQNKIAQLEHFLSARFIRQKASSIDRTVDQILLKKGFVESTELATLAQLSTAQFRKRFKEEIGISPSQFCKIIRINTTLSILQNGFQKSLTELTYQLGYFDQSHFIKDFKSVTGLSPKLFKDRSSTI